MHRMLIRNGHIVDPANRIDAIADLLICEGKINHIGDRIETEANSVIDATGLIVTPGLIDMHVHLREPGFEYKETIASGTRAAAVGGFTSVACMANTNPVADSPSVIEFIQSQAQKEGSANVFSLGSITQNLTGEALTDVPALLEAGAIGFSDDGKTVMNAELMRQVLALSAKLNFPVMVHCEEHNLNAGTVMNLGETSRKLNLPGSPNMAEDIIVARDIMLAEFTGGHLHILHVSTAGGVELIRWGKRRGVHVTGEAMPHHFALTEAAVEVHCTNAKMHPPLRTQADVDAVIEGLRDGTLDAIATDHAPHAPFEKARGMLEAPPGIIGLETCVPLVFDRLIHTGQLTLSEAVAKMTCVPANILRIDRGTLSIGSVADVTLIDPNKVAAVDVTQSASKSRNTPFNGLELRGWPVMTIRDGVVTQSTIEA
ncbi:MAG: dihydroorotase [Candidatus Poribacteria bacterium]|nr:dihydroorotase [Candidatus Poribacteria bacterium]